MDEDLTSCINCYEKWDYDDPNLVPRKLHCDHLLCSSCAQEAFDGEESCVLCPECLAQCPCSSVEALEAPLPESEKMDCEKLVRARSDESHSPPPKDPKTRASIGAMGTTSLASFMDQLDKKSRRHSSDDRSSLRSRSSERLPDKDNSNPTTPPQMIRKMCQLHRRSNSYDEGQWRFCHHEGCKRAATLTGYCERHSNIQQLHHLEKLKAEFSATPLNKLVVRQDGGNLRISKKAMPLDECTNEDMPPAPDFSPERLSKLFYSQETLQFGEAIQLIDEARAVLTKEPNVLSLEAPITVVGDIHGQFYDLLHLLKLGGEPGKETRYLFLGDYVDRGAFSCEVILYLLALKVAWPDQVYLLRGNHECTDVCAHFGFKEECAAKYGLPVYYRFLLAFQTLPLAAELSWGAGKFFACHGGLSPQFTTVAEIESLDRFREPELGDALLDILWADPVNDQNLPEMSPEEMAEFLSIQFRSNAVRGCSYVFGYSAIKEFLNKNGFLALIRAHEVQEMGQYGHFDTEIIQAKHPAYFEDNDPQLRWPPVLTVFSAPNYCGRYGNKGAMLTVHSDTVQIQLYDNVVHPEPKVLDDSASSVHLLVTGSACPYMPTSFRELVQMAMEIGPALTMPELERQHTLSSDTPTKQDCVPDDKPRVQHSPKRSSRRGSITYGMDGIAIDVSIDDAYPSDKDKAKRSPRRGSALVGGALSTEPFSASEADRRKISPMSKRGSVTYGMAIDAIVSEYNSEADSNSDGDMNSDRYLMPPPVPRPALSLDPLMAPHSKGSLPLDEDIIASPELRLEDAFNSPKRNPTRAKRSLPVGSNMDIPRPRVQSKDRKSAPILGRSLVERGSLGGDSEGSLLIQAPMLTPKRTTSGLYKFAHARDSINEMHPEILNKRIQGIQSEIGAIPQKNLNRRMSVREIRDRFETMSSKASPELDFSDKNANQKPPQTSPRHKKELSIVRQNLKINGRSVKDLAKFFNKNDEEKENIPARKPDAGAVRRLKRSSPGDSPKFTDSQKGESSFKSHVKNLAQTYEHWVGVLTGKFKKSDPVTDEKKLVRSNTDSALNQFVKENSPDEAIKKEDWRERSRSLLCRTPEKTYFASPVKQLNQAHAGAKGAEQSTSGMDDTHTSTSSLPFEENTKQPPNLDNTAEPQRSFDDSKCSEQWDALTISEHEFYALRLIFAFFDRSGKNFINRDDLKAFAEEQGDYAQHQEVDYCMSAIDSDKDGKIDLNDFIMFAVRLRHLHKMEHGGDSAKNSNDDQNSSPPVDI